MPAALFPSIMRVQLQLELHTSCWIGWLGSDIWVLPEQRLRNRPWDKSRWEKGEEQIRAWPQSGNSASGEWGSDAFCESLGLEPCMCVSERTSKLGSYFLKLMHILDFGEVSYLPSTFNLIKRKEPRAELNPNCLPEFVQSERNS